MAGLWDGDNQPAEDFTNFHKGEKPARIHTTHKHRCGRSGRRSGNRKKIQEEIQSEYDENEAERNGREMRDVFQDFRMGYLHQIEWKFSSPLTRNSSRLPMSLV